MAFRFTLRWYISIHDWRGRLFFLRLRRCLLLICRARLGRLTDNGQGPAASGWRRQADEAGSQSAVSLCRKKLVTAGHYGARACSSYSRLLSANQQPSLLDKVPKSDDVTAWTATAQQPPYCSTRNSYRRHKLSQHVKVQQTVKKW